MTIFEQVENYVKQRYLAGDGEAVIVQALEATGWTAKQANAAVRHVVGMNGFARDIGASSPLAPVTYQSLVVEANQLTSMVQGGSTAVDVNNILVKAAGVRLNPGEVAELLAQIANKKISGLGKEAVRAMYGKAIATVRNDRKANSDHWRDKLDVDKNDVPYSNLANCLIMFAGESSIRDCLVFDEFMNAVLITQCPPWQVDDGTTWTQRELVEEDIILATAFTQRNGLHRIGKEIVTDALTIAARGRTQNCVVDGLDAEQWDGTSRLDTWLIDICHVADTPFARAAGARWWIGLVARARDPGCKFENVLALESDQGFRKTTLFETVAAHFSKDFYLEFTDDISNKDSWQKLRGRLIVEFGEGHSLKGRAGTQTKPFISRKVDDYRPPYARLNAKFPRTFGWAYTGNESHYLNDPTGARRMWPFAVTRVIDIAAMERDRAQLWAEADARYKAGERWWIDASLEAEIDLAAKGAVAERYDEEVWAERIEQYLLADATGATRSDGIPGTWREGYTAADVLRYLGFPDERMKQTDKNRVGNVVRRLGYLTKTMRVNGVRGERYYLPERLKITPFDYVRMAEEAAKSAQEQ